MTTTYAQFKSLIKILIRNNLSFSKLSKNPKKSARIAAAFGIGLLVIVMMAYAGVMAVSMTIAASNSDMLTELLYMVIFMAQVVVLFFGGFAVMNYLYHSKDNMLLSSLPLSPKALFLAKFTMAYVAQLFFSAMIIFPFMTSIGVSSFVLGLGLPWYFFVLEILLIFLVPILPLLLVTILSVPLMYVMSFIKRSSVASGIIMIIIYGCLFALYFFMISMFTGVGGGEGSSEIVAMPANAIAMFTIIKNITIFNYPMVEAFLGRNVLLNLLYYLGGLAILGTAAVALSSFFYRKALVTMAESNSSAKRKKSKNKVEIVSQSVTKAFFLKEIRTLVHTPMLLMSSLMGVIMMPLVMVFMSFSMPSAENGADGMSPIFMIGMLTYIAYIMVCATNMIATIGFSREGKHLLVLKSLPISATTMVKTKLFFATSVTVLLTIISSIAFPLTTGISDPVAIIGFPISLLLGGFGMNCIGLYNDLKNPNLKWNNINELTKNNKRQLKPMLIGVGVGLLHVVVGSILAFQNAITGTLMYLLFFGICIIPSIILVIVGVIKLFDNPEALLDKIEG